MVKNLFWVIFISVLIISCDSQIVIGGDEDEYIDDEIQYSIDITSYLPLENGYYQMEYLNGYNQTFTTLTTETGSNDKIQYVEWMTNKQILINGIWTNIINSVSYTDDLGEAHTVLSAWPEFIGDTITVYAGYYDEYFNHYVDSLKVIVTDEE
jgi:hypothetical protein